ncbi:anti-sigma factor family protein [Paraburkholderia youngii]|uniref:anti-sigma factor family protein n=1 Tax=Paraburkholderia youngii TaxID=2782701 RepID=UPI003D1A9DEB
MMIDDATLLAYVDGALPPDECPHVERAIRESDDLSLHMSTLRASRLPYAAAFGRQALPPLPETLRRNVDELLRQRLAGARAPQAVNDATAIHAIDIAGGRESGESWLASGGNFHRPKPRASLPWLAVAFVTGAVCCGFAYRLLPQLSGGGAIMTESNDSSVSPWIAAAASYQQLYTRDTVASLQPDLRATAATVAEIRRDDGLAVKIPDLRSQGLSFKRVQRLSFRGKPLVQIVYLPEHGAPVALCVLKEAKADAVPASKRIGGMDVVTWRRGQLGYALIGEHGGLDLDALGKQLYDGQMSTTIGRNDAHEDARLS